MWFAQWKDESVIDVSYLDCNKFKWEFLDRFFPIEMKETEVQEVSNLTQVNMSVKD